MNFDNTEIFPPKPKTEPRIVNDSDTKTLEFIYGNPSVQLTNIVQLAGDDVWYLLDHLFHNLMNIMTNGNALGGVLYDEYGEEQLQNWRLINLLFIISGVLTKEEVKEKFMEICEIYSVEDDHKILELFDRYIVSDRAIDGQHE